MTAKRIPISSQPPDSANRFVCVDCGRWVINFPGPVLFKLCATCIQVPGWNTIQELRERLDPTHCAVWYDRPPEPGTLQARAKGKR